MTLNEAIQHAYDMYEVLKETPCGEEHLQLYRWLCELKRFKDEEANIDAGYGCE